MQKSKKAESLVGIVIGIFILSFVLIGIGNLIGISKQDIGDFNEKMQIDILKQNTAKIVDNLSLTGMYDRDVFYIYKDKINKEFKIFIGEHNMEYKYINSYGDKVDNPITYDNKVFERILQLRKQKINGEEKLAIRTLIRKLEK